MEVLIWLAVNVSHFVYTRLINTLTSEKKLLFRGHHCTVAIYCSSETDMDLVAVGVTDYFKVHELLEASSRVREGQTFVNQLT